MDKAARIKKLNNAGLTLVEMIVTFALLGLFMVAATRVISYTVNIYYAAKGINMGLEVSNMVTDKVAGMMSGMRNDIEMNLDTLGTTLTADDSFDGSVTTTTDFPVMNQDNSAIYFVDESGCPVRIGLKNDPADSDGYLQITYFSEDNSVPGVISYKAVPWYFAKENYMGYNVKDFTIEKAGADYPDNVFKLTCTVTSERFGDYTAERYIKCRNLD